jgi:hypothetical protein
MSGPNAIRKAWCELSGGHENHFLLSRKGSIVDHIKMHCIRCETETPWHPCVLKHLGLGAEKKEDRGSRGKNRLTERLT